MQVPWLLLRNLIREYLWGVPSTSVTSIASPETLVTTPEVRDMTTCPLSIATLPSMPVPTSGASVRTRGTAWRCILEPMRALLASSCSKKGIKAADTLTICIGDISI